jgi:hypothetical protein
VRTAESQYAAAMPPAARRREFVKASMATDSDTPKRVMRLQSVITNSIRSDLRRSTHYRQAAAKKGRVINPQQKMRHIRDQFAEPIVARKSASVSV